MNLFMRLRWMFARSRNIRHACVTIVREEGGLFSGCLFRGLGPSLIVSVQVTPLCCCARDIYECSHNASAQVYTYPGDNSHMKRMGASALQKLWHEPLRGFLWWAHPLKCTCATLFGVPPPPGYIHVQWTCTGTVWFTCNFYLSVSDKCTVCGTLVAHESMCTSEVLIIQL